MLQMMKKAKAGEKKIARIKPKWAERVRDLKRGKNMDQYTRSNKGRIYWHLAIMSGDVNTAQQLS